jgi:NDP-sugar pyrophosphorylase family protein
MTNEDKQYMLNQQKKGEAYTLMGITLADRKLALEKLEDLELHRTSQNKTPQFHHVDLLTLFYEGYRGIYDLPQLEAENRKDEFRPYKTNCFKYDKFVFSGLNRWENLMDGVDYLYKENRRFLARKFRARVEPDAKVTIALSRDNLEPDIEIGEGCYFAGTIHLGRRVTIGDYCILKDVVLTNEVKVGNLVKLINVRADYTEFKSNTEPKWIDPILHTDTITGKIPMTNIRDCLLKNSKIGAECDLFDVDIRNTIIPERKRLRRVDIYNGLVRKGVIGERAEVSDWSINVKREFFSPGEYQRKQILTIPDISDFPREFVIL